MYLLVQNMEGGGKVVVVSDEWRNNSVEERIQYSLVKVSGLQANRLAITKSCVLPSNISIKMSLVRLLIDLILS